MKKLLIVTLVCFSITSFAETKKVCHDRVVKGKTVSVCKQVKIHKKFEGTVVPEKKKK